MTKEEEEEEEKLSEVSFDVATTTKEIPAKRSGKGDLNVERTAVVDVEKETNDVKKEPFVFACDAAFHFRRNGRIESNVNPIDRMRNGENNQHDDLNGKNFDQLISIATDRSDRRVDDTTRSTNVFQR